MRLKLYIANIDLVHLKILLNQNRDIFLSSWISFMARFMRVFSSEISFFDYFATFFAAKLLSLISCIWLLKLACSLKSLLEPPEYFTGGLIFEHPVKQ